MSKKKQIKEPKQGLHYLYLVIIVVTAIIAFIPSLNNDFVNWDDIIYVMNNDMIKSITFFISDLRSLSQTILSTTL